jgi:hypothetical protein
MASKYDFEERGRQLVSALGSLSTLCGGAEMLPSPEQLADTLALLRDQAERVYNDGMALVFPEG